MPRTRQNYLKVPKGQHLRKIAFQEDVFMTSWTPSVKQAWLVSGDLRACQRGISRAVFTELRIVHKTGRQAVGKSQRQIRVPSLKSAGERGRLKKKETGVYAYRWMAGAVFPCGRTFCFFLKQSNKLYMKYSHSWNRQLFHMPTMWPQITVQLDVEMRDDWIEGPRHRLGFQGAMEQSLAPC